MKTAIIYYSKHHGNTKKLVDAIMRGTRDEVLSVDAGRCAGMDLSKYDRIGFASGIYYSRFHEEVIRAVERLPEKQKVFFLYTCGVMRKGYTAAIEEAATRRGAQILGAYGCPGFDTFGPLKLIGGIAKGRPNQSDFERAVSFYLEQVKGK